MDATPDNMILSSLAEKLSGKQVESESIYNALEIICRKFKFKCGMIYEIDQFNSFNKKEYYADAMIRVPDSFSIESISPEYRTILSENIMLYIDRNETKNNYELDFIKMFFAQNLACVTIVDETFRINGFMVLINTDLDKNVLLESMTLLSTLLNMVGRSLSVRAYQNKVKFSQMALENVLDNTGIDIYVNDFYTHDILYVNKSMAAPYGGKERFSGRKCWDILFPGRTGPCEFCPQKKIVDAQGNPTKVYSWDYQRPFDGSWFRVFSAAFRWMDGRLAHVVSSADITENKRNEALIEYMANYDSLTNLPNRRMLINECERRITHAEEGDTACLLFFDIDGFKAINDNFGHDAGDEFLVELGKFFIGIPMLKDAIYRNGGDEFVALLGGDITKAHIRSLVSFIHERFKKPWKLKSGDVFCNVSVGVACYPQDGATAEALLNKADQAMYHVKKSGGGSICFGYEMKAEGHEARA